MTRGWKNESHRHSLSARGIRTGRKGVSAVLPDGRRLAVNNYVAGGEWSDIVIHGWGFDVNGNRVLRLSFGGGRGFSIQTNGNLPVTHSIIRGLDKVSDLSDDHKAILEDEVIAYIKYYGTDSQKRKLYSGLKYQDYDLEKYVAGGLLDKISGVFKSDKEKEAKAKEFEEKIRGHRKWQETGGVEGEKAIFVDEHEDVSFYGRKMHGAERWSGVASGKRYPSRKSMENYLWHKFNDVTPNATGEEVRNYRKHIASRSDSELRESYQRQVTFDKPLSRRQQKEIDAGVDSLIRRKRR